jgi:ribose transport system ATP-binding protein
MEKQPLLEARGIDKHFPGVHALRSVDLDLYEGEVHFVLGENGAGKSTLMKIISGTLPMDSGRIVLRGQPVEIHSPQQAQHLGIGMVYQEFSLIPALSAAENIFLGRPPKNNVGMVDWQRLYDDAGTLLGSLGSHIDPRGTVRDLRRGEQQLVEIAKALSMNASILILDEPTAALSEEERTHLFQVLRGLQARGVGIVYISHRLADVPEIGQRVTVMRDGKVVSTLPVAETNDDILISMMVGRDMHEQYPKESVERGEPVLRVAGLARAGVFSDVSFTVHRGEIVGIFGIMGAGRSETARAIFGLDPHTAGEIYVDGQSIEIHSAEDGIAAGIGYVSEDRKMALVQQMAVPPNITLASIKRMSRAGVMNKRSEQEASVGLINSLHIQPPDPKRLVQYLSGGNQQKVLLARWLCTNSKVLILDEPTQGIDVGAKAEIFRLMCTLAKNGVGILMISSELPEVMAMSDRILVMARGRIVAEYVAAEATPEEIMRDAAGGSRQNGK